MTRNGTATSAKQRMLYGILLFMILTFGSTGVSAAETALKKATLMPLWSPQAQFAGYYVALQKGIYARHGIDLKILKAGPGYSSAQALRNGSADFAVLWLTTALQQHAEGTQLVNLAQMIQRSSMLLIAKKSARITSVSEMNGKKVGMWGGELSLPPRTLFSKHGITVREIPLTHTVNLFLRGGIDLTSAMWYNEYHTIINTGLDPEELQIFSLYDLGLNFPEDGLYTLEKTMQKDPALVKAFTEASLEGWRYAFAHPDEALNIVLQQMYAAQIPANRTHQKWMLDRMRDLIQPTLSKSRPGVLSQRDYEAVGRTMQKSGLISQYPDYRIFTGGSHAGQN